MATSDGEHRVTTPQPAEPRPRRPRPEVPTLVQLGLKPARDDAARTVRTLPGVRSAPHLPPLVHDGRAMPDLSLHYERVEGHWIGAIGVNTVCVMGLMLIVLGATTFAMFPIRPRPGR